MSHLGNCTIAAYVALVIIKEMTTRRKKLFLLLTSGALLFYATSGVSSLLNYAIYPVVARFTTVAEYGEVQFLLSAFNQLAVGFVVLNILAIIATARVHNDKDPLKTVKSLNIAASVIASMVAIVGVSVILLFATELQLTSPFAIVLTGFALILNVPFTILLGQLQGQGRFAASAVVSLVATGGKFILSVVLGAAGFGVAGVMMGVLLGMLASVIAGGIIAGSPKGNHVPFRQHLSLLAPLKTYALTGLLAIGTVTILSSIDLIGARMLLDSTMAGEYAAVATVAKIIIAAGSPLLWLSLPPALSGNFVLIKRYLILTISACVAFIAMFSIAPAALVQLVTSIDPGIYADIMLVASVGMSVYAIAFILCAILVCIREFRSLAIICSSSIFLTITLALLTAATGGGLSMTSLIYIQAAIGLVLATASLTVLMRNVPSRRMQSA